MNETELSVITTMALADNDIETEYCPFCRSRTVSNIQFNERMFSIKRHESDCSIAEARTILREQNIPVNLFAIIYEQEDFNPLTIRYEWREHSWTYYALEESDVRMQFHTVTDMCLLRNEMIAAIREM